MSDYFRNLIKDCIKAYEKLSNDGLALDYCRVSDKKLRAMILGDEEYRIETKNIYARQRLEEMEEVEHLASLADGGESNGFDSNGFDSPSDDWYEPRDGKKPPNQQVHKDIIAMRFKAAQMKRELRAELANMEGDNERDSINLMYLPVGSREELLKLQTVELNAGTDDADLDALIGIKEDIPVGTSGKNRLPKKKTVASRSFEKILEDGEIIEE